MTLLVHDCERCSRRVSRPGDHLCTGCATLLGRDVREPFWGDFASHPDSKLLPRLPGEARRARAFVSVIDALLSGKAA